MNERICDGLGGKIWGEYRETYRGYKVYYCEGQPVTGRYRAGRFGVFVGAGTLEQVRRLVDWKIYAQPAHKI